MKKIIELLKRFRSFVQETKTELKKVSWPNKDEVYRVTVIVILTSFFFGFYLFVVDLALQFGINYIMKVFKG